MSVYSTLYDSNKIIAWVDLSTYCNAGCPQCHRTNINGLDKVDWLPLVQWSLKTFKKAYPIDVLKRHSNFEICGTWGDPIMNKDIFYIVEYIIKNCSADIQINTNGSMRSPDWWWDLGVLGGRRLKVWFDIDGVNQEMHNLYRQKTDLNKIKENVESYCSTNAIANAHVIVFKHNENHLYEIYDFIRNLGITGEVIFELSNRFNRESIFSFTDNNGNHLKLEQATIVDHPLINGKNPIRDHNWKKQKGIVHHELQDNV